MTVYPSELQRMFEEMDAEEACERARRRATPGRHECDCGRLYPTVDELIACAGRGHR